jgi:polyhydroxyalkanoate synthase
MWGSALGHPFAMAAASMRLGMGMMQASQAVWWRCFGLPVGGPETPDVDDRRFRHPLWQTPYFYGLEQQYLLGCRFAEDVLEAAALPAEEQPKARFALEIACEAAAPGNYLWGNPEAQLRALETGGASLVRGASHMLDDMRNRGGLPSLADTSTAQLGKDLAVTPGVVVYRNRLIELIQYVPQTESVHSVPLLCCPAWINRYYILDLSPGRSLVEWAVQHGHTVFVVSYRNPDAELADLTFSDYLTLGPLSAIDAVRRLTGQEQVHLLALCLGGTLAVATMAMLHELKVDALRTCTLVNSHVDFSIPGPLGCFADADAVHAVEQRMAGRGYVLADEMTQAFRMIRSRDLIWQTAIDRWLLGNDPKPADLLVWNEDATNIPGRMQTYYLRKCYQENALAQDRMYLAGKRLNVTRVVTDTYVVGAHSDHIVPWHSSYKTTQILAGDVRYVLADAGHIGSIVHPPGPKARYYHADAQPADPDAWLKLATCTQGSWWSDWIAWLSQRSGEKIAADSRACAGPNLGTAPGAYVFS